MGGVVDFVGDVGEGIIGAVGDVAEGVGDFAGDIIEDFGPEIATAIALYYMGPAALTAEGAAAAGAAETFGSSTAAEILANQAASSAFNSGLGTIGSSFLPGGTPGGGYGGGFIKTGIEGLDSALNIAKSGYDLYNTANSLNRPSSQQYPYTQQIPALTYQQTSSGTQVDPNAFGQGLQYSFMAGLPEFGDIQKIITNSVSGLGNILLNAFGTDNLSEVIKKYGPAVLSVIGGKLSYDDQKRINDIVMGVYNKYNVGTELKGLQYKTGQGLASLPVARGGKPLGSQTMAVAPQRTAADVVVRPKAEMGGIMGTEQLSPMQPAMQSAMYNPLENNYFSGKPMMADGGSPEDEMELRNEFNYNRRKDEMEDLLDEYQRFKMRKDYQKRYPRDEARNGGRMRYAMGSTQQPMQMQPMNNTKGIGKSLVSNAMKDPRFMQILQQVKAGKTTSRPGYKYGSPHVRTNQAGITELDYRGKGGYVPPIGVKEKADDIPAMLSNNEFVFTANAVRNAGGGSVKEGAKKMYSLMRQLEGRS
jgi:hypothetical protein